MAYLDSTGLSQQVGHIKAYVNNKISSDVTAINDAAIQTAWSNIEPDTDLNTYAPLISPNLVGTPTAPTANANTDNNQIATTAFVKTAINAEAEARTIADQNVEENLLPLNGSKAMTGALQGNMANYSVKNISEGNEGSTSVYGANGTESGSYAKFYGMSNVDFPGWFSLGASDGVDTAKLVGKPDGTLTWTGKNVAVAGDYLPTSGGMLTGQISWMNPTDNEFFFGPNVTDDPNMLNVDIGWNYANRDGAGIGLRSVNHSSQPGCFNIYCRDETNTYTLVGTPSTGQLTWSGPTPAVADNSTKIATTAYVKDCVPVSIGAASTAVYTNANGVITKGNAFVPTSGGTFSGTVYFTRTTDAGATSTTMPAVVIGGAAAAKHIAIDNDEIMAVADNNAVGTLYINNDGGTVNVGKAAGGLVCNGSSAVYPRTTKTITLGASSYLWKQLYATTATISTSDEREKQLINNVPNEILDAWSDVDWYQFKFNDAVKEKGSDVARFHTGLIAQRINHIFKERNLDITDYGLFCYDEWDAKEAVYSDNGKLLEEPVEAGNAYAIRYEEALALEAAWQRRENKKLLARIEALEAKIAAMEE